MVEASETNPLEGDKTMKYMMFIKHAEGLSIESVPQGLLDAMGQFVEQGFKSGVLKDTAGLKPTKEGFRVSLSGGKMSVKDGPFSETKEVVGGYAIVDVKSREEALKLAQDFMELHRIHWPAFEGVSEVRPIENN
jgi:hypothetical protein